MEIADTFLAGVVVVGRRLMRIKFIAELTKKRFPDELDILFFFSP